ncbi:maltose acetyltransferase domain-containing protein [Pseudoalteromonas neustonica]|uniref:Maltose acetyltransferase domain-containing protein n=1 Tax=Pseudoalteromonas neustonica TaxID=1840331 RepID=A0ABU9TWV2_9GAMM
MPYIASDPELANTRTHAKLVCHQFNLADPTTPYE